VAEVTSIPSGLDDNVAELIHHFRESVEYFHKDHESEWSPKNLAFVSRLRLNAFVESEGDGATLCFWDGCGICLTDIISSLIAHSQFMPDVRRSFSTVGRREEWRYWNYGCLLEKGAKRQPFRLARTSYFTKPDLAMFDHLYELCVRFIFKHEHFHVYLGHLSEAASHGLLCLEETTSSAASVDPKKRRKWELEADMGALSDLLNAGRDEHYRKTAYLPYNSVAEWDRSILTTCGLVFALLQIAEEGIRTPVEERNHPSAAARMLHLLICYISFIRDGTFSHDAASTADLFDGMWTYVLGSFASIATITGILPIAYADLKASIFMSDESTWPITPTVRECLDCLGLDRFPKVAPYAEVFVPMDFFAKSERRIKALDLKRFRLKVSERQFDDPLAKPSTE
jgi:hypothetical protein